MISGNGKQPISFFKILTWEDFAHFLRLPQAFLQRYGSILPEKVKLREGRRSWMVEVEAMEEEEDGVICCCCFSRGWNTFAKDVGLKPMEALEFVVADDDAKTLDVTLFGVDGCQRRFEDDDDVFVTRGKLLRPKPRKEEGTSWKKSSPLYFEIDLKIHHRSRLTLVKKKFSVGAGLIGDKTVQVIGERYSDCIGLDHRGGTRIDLMAGWLEFRRKNAITFGKTYSFEFNPTKKAIYVKEVVLVKKSN